MRFWCTSWCCERSTRSKATGTRTYRLAEVVKILFSCTERERGVRAGFHASSKRLVFECRVCHPLVPVFLAKLPRPCTPRGTTEIKKIRRVRVYIRSEIFVRLECLLNDLRSHFLNGNPRFWGFARHSMEVKRIPLAAFPSVFFGKCTKRKFRVPLAFRRLSTVRSRQIIQSILENIANSTHWDVA